MLKYDVLTLLVHLGYLTYNFETKEVSIPNYEISNYDDDKGQSYVIQKFVKDQFKIFPA